MPNKSHPPTDTLYARKAAVSDFVFDQRVVNVFPDMINRSVPGYGTIVHMTGQLAERYAKPDSQCYDLGCSLGAATFSMAKRVQGDNINIIAVDSSQAMVGKLASLVENERLVERETLAPTVTVVHDDILNVDISRASVVVLNFTLQFIPLSLRELLFQKIYAGMLPGGILILSEKITFADQNHSELVNDMHHYFKKTNGYSDLEIAQKRSALENVLLPETVEQHFVRLNECDFKNANLWFQCFNFISLIAFK